MLERVGRVAYRLQLPLSSRIHPVFHVSQLKKCLRPNQEVLSELPNPDLSLQFPVRVLQRRVRQRGHTTVVQGLIQWSGASEDLATWEDMEALKQQFPSAPAWGQAGFQGGRIVNDHDRNDSATVDQPVQRGTVDQPATEQEAGQDLVQGNCVMGRPKRITRLPARLAGREWAR